MVIWLTIALIGAAFRIIDGRGKEWIPLPGGVRHGFIVAICLVAAWLATGTPLGTVWCGGLAGWALIHGFDTDAWDSMRKMLAHYGLPICLLIWPGIFGIGYQAADTWPLYVALMGAVAAGYYVKNRWFAHYGGWWSYLSTEGPAGAAIVGGMALI